MEEEEAVDVKELVGRPTVFVLNAVTKHYIKEEFPVFPRRAPTVEVTWLHLSKHMHMTYDACVYQSRVCVLSCVFNSGTQSKKTMVAIIPMMDAMYNVVSCP